MEILGTMNEQTGAHEDAALNYEQAWKYSRKNQPTIGKEFSFLGLEISDGWFVCHRL